MRYIRIKALLLLFVTFPVNCTEIPMSTYSADQITSLKSELIDEDTVKIVYRIMLETLYYCPGANVEKVDNKVLISFVRCSIDKSCSITNKSQKEASGENTILVTHNKMPIYVVSEAGKKKIYPE